MFYIMCLHYRIVIRELAIPFLVIIILPEQGVSKVSPDLDRVNS